MPKSTTDDDLELLNALGIDLAPDPVRERSAREERMIAGFEEIQRFVEEQGRLPQQGDDRDIFERLYAVRLDRLRELAECHPLLEPLDSQGLLKAETPLSPMPEAEDLTDAELLASLGIESDAGNDLTQLTHVRSRQEIKAAEEVAQRTPCPDFQQFKPLFKQVQADLKTGVRQTLKYQDNAAIHQGDLFILEGHQVLVAEMGETFMGDHGRPDARLRVVYDNGTESNLLLRSLQRALNKDKISRRITTPDLGPLFSQLEAQDDIQTGYIYVLRSQSEDPFIAQHRSIIHKIGVTGSDVKKRVANAKKDPTYLLAEVDIVATFKLANINRTKLEALLHKVFEPVRLDLELQDRFGIAVQPREWFFVPLSAIEEAIQKIQSGTLHQFQYDPDTASLKPL
ncbi:MAG: GIY-YIG nuclease family protein [Prochlorothrix sp.]|nr:GIY-YIG nuclease family protein [Prochlorothrix sp.]